MREGTVTICSIYPMESVEERPLFQPDNKYVLQAAQKGQIATLEIRNQRQPENVGHGRHFPVHIPATEVAADLVRIWILGRLWPGIPDGAQPGIWIPENEETPSQEEIATMQRAQDLFADAVIDQADRYARDGEHDSINETHYLFAAYRGITGRDWQKGALRRDSGTCPFCDTSIPRRVAKCPKCLEIVDQALYDKLVRERQVKPQPETAEEVPKPDPADEAIDFDIDFEPVA